MDVFVAATWCVTVTKPTHTLECGFQGRVMMTAHENVTRTFWFLSVPPPITSLLSNLTPGIPLRSSARRASAVGLRGAWASTPS
jgi:hypothetical protein